MITFRPGSPDEAERMAALEARVAGWPWSAGQYRDSLSGDHQAIVIEQDGQAVGHILLMQVLDEAEILNIAIDLPCQGRGLGRQLLEQALQTLAGQGIRRVFLEVRESNRSARALYTRRGFRQCGLRKHYYPGHDGRENAILMEIAL
jgi:[ribosomal protein S18]-alanine N-acetyltransferase